MEMRLAGLVRESVVDGPGIRLTIFFQGCPHACPGCHNPETHDFDGGYLFDSEAILAEVEKRPLLKGITLSGGEPLAQPVAAAALAVGAKRLGRQVMVYTGYLWEDLLDMAWQEPAITELLAHTDILMDGPFVQSQKSLGLTFRGSANQRAIDVPASLQSGAVVEYAFYVPGDGYER